jgi:hypothetical protein
MLQDEIFEKNTKALFKHNSLLSTEVFGANNKKFEIYRHNDDYADLNFIDTKNHIPLYETTPMQEINKQIKLFEEKYIRYPILFFFGMGNGVLIKLLLSNPQRKKIVVIEPDPEILFIVFHLLDFSKEIEEGKLVILSPNQLTYPEAEKITSDTDILLFLKTYELHINTNYYDKLYSKEILNSHQIFARAIKQTIINFGNDTKDTLIGIEHSIQNLPLMLENPPIQQLSGKKNTNLAVIVSTGPSLAKQLPLLKEIQDYVTIISIDASMPILEKWDIVPDFVVSLERVIATSNFFKKTSKEFQEKFITIHASLQHEEVLKHSYGDKILSMRGFLYNRYFELDDYGYLGIGMSAANMAYELAFLLGIKNITLIGQDLAFSQEGDSHSKGHVFGNSEIKFSENDLYVTQYGGEGVVRTTRVWMMFKNIFEKDIYTLNQKGIKTFNSTEGGARIEGAIEKPFKEVIEEYCQKTPKQKINISKENINTKKNLKQAYQKTIHMIEKGEYVQKEIEKTFLKVAKECENLIYLNEHNQLEKIDFKYLGELSKEIDDIKSLIEEEEFFKMYGETITSYLINKETDLAKIQVINPIDDIHKKAKLIDWIMNHKEWLFMLAGSINAQIIVIKRALNKIEDKLNEYKIK